MYVGADEGVGVCECVVLDVRVDANVDVGG